MQVGEAAIRRATERDLPALFTLLTEYFAEGEVRHTESPETLLKMTQVPLLGFYLAEDPSGMAGCIQCRLLPSVHKAAECKRLYVRPEYRGRGIASRLMESIEGEARAAGFQWMYLDSKENFAAAIGLYRKRGYAACARFNDNPEATFFFRKRLP